MNSLSPAFYLASGALLVASGLTVWVGLRPFCSVLSQRPSAILISLLVLATMALSLAVVLSQVSGKPAETDLAEAQMAFRVCGRGGFVAVRSIDHGVVCLRSDGVAIP